MPFKSSRRNSRSKSKKRAGSKIRKATMSTNVCSVLAGRKQYTVTQEFPVFVYSAAAVAAGATQVGYYSLGYFNGTTNAPFSASNTPNVQIDLFSALFNSTAATGTAPNIESCWGYSGKFKEAISDFQYMRVKGFKLTYINSQSTGSSSASANSGLVLVKEPDLAFTIFPEALRLYLGNPATYFANQIVPSDIYELDASLKVQPNNTSLHGAMKYFTVPTFTIQQDVMTPSNNPVIPNAWNSVNNYTVLDWSLIMGHESFPRLFNPSASPTAANVTFQVGTIRVETIIDFTVPIKNITA